MTIIKIETGMQRKEGREIEGFDIEIDAFGKMKRKFTVE